MIDYIRDISVADYNGLRRSVGWSAVEESQAKTGIRNSFFLTAAVADGRPVGMARVVGDGGYFMLIVDVVVHPEFQGLGIGRDMMKQAMNAIHTHMKAGQSVMVNLMSAKGKEPFYEKFGFTARPSDKHGAGMVMYVTPEKEK